MKNDSVEILVFSAFSAPISASSAVKSFRDYPDE